MSIRTISLRARWIKIVGIALGLSGVAVAAATGFSGEACPPHGCLHASSVTVLAQPSPSTSGSSTATTPQGSTTPSANPTGSPSEATGVTVGSGGTSGTTSGSDSQNQTTPSSSPSPTTHPTTHPTSYPSPTPTDTRASSARSDIRYIADGTDSAVRAVKSLGYNVIDTSSMNRSTIDSLGAKVIIYTGYDKDTCQWKVPDSTWQSAVLNLRSDPNVVGWFLADEPHPYIYGKCTSSAAQIKARADYLHANAPGQKAMIVVLDGSNACPGMALGCEYKFYNEAATHADLIGVDPYVCSTAHPSCDFTKITQRVNSAVASGIPLTKIMPVYQAFGGDGYYLMPTASQQAQMLQTWDSLAPSGGWAGEYTYEWSQSSEPDGLSNHPQNQQVFAAHNGA